MKAVILTQPTKSDEIKLTETDIPQMKSGWVLVKIKAFGINHSEKLLRTFEITQEYITKPIIPGIECVGIIDNPGDTDLKCGDKVIAMMGGMGRMFNGSYAEYALLPRKNVFRIETNLSFEQIGAIPETFWTAWGSLTECLNIHNGETLLIRGATSALGYAAVMLAKAMGARVIGSTHKQDKLCLLKNCDEAIWDNGKLSDQVHADKILELIGPKTIRDSLHCLNKGGIVCHTGILGGVYTLDNFDPIKEIPNGCYLTGFFSNYPTQQGIDDMFRFINEHHIVPIYTVYSFDNIRNALMDIDAHKINGKVVISLN